MDIFSRISELRLRLQGEQNIVFVPTMGNLHAGHIALMTQAKTLGQCVVASIFVNPLQFGANEDLANYPRTLEQDCRQLYEAGVNVVFTPSETELYPQPQIITVKLPEIANELCGAHRPGHFEGMATVVLKLLNIVRPQTAVFGKKDFQQLHIIRQMVQQFNLPVNIEAGNTVRESDGLAMSSRNGYLKPEQRLEAPRLYKTLQQAVNEVRGGKHAYDEVAAQSAHYLTMLGWVMDYIEIRNAQTLAPAKLEDKHLVVLGAARLGRTRLIDNIEFAL